MVTLVNVTEQVNYKIELKKMNDYKDKLLSTVSHELKTPVNSAMSSFYSISQEKDIKRVWAKALFGLNIIKLLLFLIHDLLDLSQINKGVLRLASSIVNLVEIAEETIELMEE